MWGDIQVNLDALGCCKLPSSWSIACFTSSPLLTLVPRWSVGYGACQGASSAFDQLFSRWWILQEKVVLTVGELGRDQFVWHYHTVWVGNHISIDKGISTVGSSHHSLNETSFFCNRHTLLRVHVRLSTHQTLWPGCLQVRLHPLHIRLDWPGLTWDVMPHTHIISSFLVVKSDIKRVTNCQLKRIRQT